MRLYLINNKCKMDITDWVSEVTLKGEYRSCCRTLEFSIIKYKEDKNTYLANLFLGDNIELVENNKTMFYGVVWNKSKSTTSDRIDISCNDFGIYLMKNYGYYKFRNITPEAITEKIAKDKGLQVNNIARTYKQINRNFIGVNLYDIIMTCYNLANDKKYMIKFDSNKLSVYEKGVVLCKPLKSDINILNLALSEGLENVINIVNVYDKDSNLVYSNSDDKLIEKYGLLEQTMSSEDKEYINNAKLAIKDVEQKINVTNLGDISYVTGNAVMIEEPYTGVKGKFYIDSDTHVWKNGIYTNSLVLNFKNIMDEKEAGNYDEKYEKQQTTTTYDSPQSTTDEVDSNTHIVMNKGIILQLN